MKKFVKVLSLLLAMLMIMGCFTACGSSGTDETKPSGDEGGNTEGGEFMVAWWGADVRHNKTMEVLKEFDRLNGGESKVKYCGSSEFWSMLDIDIAGNTIPDVFQMTYGKIETYAESGNLLDLAPYYESGALDLSNVDEKYMEMCYYQDGMYAIPTGVNVPVYLYNPADVKAAGCELPRNPTLDQLIDVAKKIYDHSGKKMYMEFEEYVRMHGESYYTEDGKQVGFSPEILVDFWKFEREGMEYGYFAKPEEGIEGGQQAMIDGKYWCFTTFSNQISTCEENTALDLEWMAIPCTDEVKATTYVQPNTLWCIGKTTDNPDRAIALLNFFTNSEYFYDTLGYDRGMAISAEIREYMAPKATADMKEQAQILEELEALGSLCQRPVASVYDGQAKSALSDYMQMNKYGMFTEADMPAMAEEAIQMMNEDMAKAAS